MFKWILFLNLATLTVGCQSASKKNIEFLSERVKQLKPLSRWAPLECELEATLTEPARARYQQMLGQEKPQESTRYLWRGRETVCEILAPQSKSKQTDAQKPLLESSICLLMQVHWVNSPFDELKVDLERLNKVEDQLHVPTGDDPELGIFLNKNDFTLQTRTKSRGVLFAQYQEVNGIWAPIRLEQRLAGSRIVVDEMTYAQEAKPGARPQLKSFWISVGAEQAFKHSYVEMQGCKPY